MKFLKNIKGQTLIEALIALGVTGIIIGAIAVAVLSGMDNANFSNHQNLATQYAQQGMDLVRQMSESDWATFSTKIGTYCLDLGSINLGSPGACPTPTVLDSFVRTVVISNIDPACPGGNYYTKVIVSWTDGSCSSSNLYCHNVSLDSCFAQINNVPNP